MQAKGLDAPKSRLRQALRAIQGICNCHADALYIKYCGPEGRAAFSFSSRAGDGGWREWSGLCYGNANGCTAVRAAYEPRRSVDPTASNIALVVSFIVPWFLGVRGT